MSKRVDPSVVKAVAVLLSYPTEATVEALPELRSALGDSARLQPLFDLLAGDLFDAQEAYVETFDRGRVAGSKKAAAKTAGSGTE